MSAIFEKKKEREDTQMTDCYEEYDQAKGANETDCENMQEPAPEHYDGKTVQDVFGTEELPEGRRESFPQTRDYLRQVRDHKRRTELLKERINYNQAAGTGTTALENDLEYAAHLLNVKVAEVADEISKIGQVNQEAVLIRRYIDLMPWDEIAEKLDFRMRTVLKLHGYGLPALEKILLQDGLITIEEEDSDDQKDLLTTDE